MSKKYYGLDCYKDNMHTMANRICECLGGSRDVEEMIIETAIVETHGGEYKDPTHYAGMGLTKIDQVPFQDIKDRANESDVNKIFKAFSINIKHVDWVELRHNPFLALLFTRLFYKKIPEKIPNSIKARAFYWKKYYNSSLGKGTEEHYINTVTKYKTNL